MQRRREQPANFGRPKVEPSSDAAVTHSREVRGWLLDSSVGLISYRTAAGSPGKRVRRERVGADVPSQSALCLPGLIRSNPLDTPDRAWQQSGHLYKDITKPSSRSTSTIKPSRTAVGFFFSPDSAKFRADSSLFGRVRYIYPTHSQRSSQGLLIDWRAHHARPGEAIEARQAMGVLFRSPSACASSPVAQKQLQ